MKAGLVRRFEGQRGPWGESSKVEAKRGGPPCDEMKVRKFKLVEQEEQERER